MAIFKKKPEEAQPITDTRYHRRYVGRKETIDLTKFLCYYCKKAEG